MQLRVAAISSFKFPAGAGARRACSTSPRAWPDAWAGCYKIEGEVTVDGRVVAARLGHAGRVAISRDPCRAGAGGLPAASFSTCEASIRAPGAMPRRSASARSSAACRFRFPPAADGRGRPRAPAQSPEDVSGRQHFQPADGALPDLHRDSDRSLAAPGDFHALTVERFGRLIRGRLAAICCSDPWSIGAVIGAIACRLDVAAVDAAPDCPACSRSSQRRRSLPRYDDHRRGSLRAANSAATASTRRS